MHIVSAWQMRAVIDKTVRVPLRRSARRRRRGGVSRVLIQQLQRPLRHVSQLLRVYAGVDWFKVRRHDSREW